jgi:hypothetical protein
VKPSEGSFSAKEFHRFSRLTTITLPLQKRNIQKSYQLVRKALNLSEKFLIKEHIEPKPMNPQGETE